MNKKDQGVLTEWLVVSEVQVEIPGPQFNFQKMMLV
jgi:hypothetical protein